MASSSSLTRAKERQRLPSQLGAIVEFLSGEERGRRVPLLFSRTVFGRKFADILIRDPNVSGTHFAIDYRRGKFKVTDLGSSNGTFVDDQKVKEVVLEKEMILRAGESTLRIVFNPEEAEQLVAAMPAMTRWSEGGLTGLIEDEFISSNVHSQDRTIAVRTTEGGSSIIRLTVTLGADRGKTFTFTKKQVIVGRIDTDLVLADRDVSRKHLLIERQEDQQILLRDLASSNGTFVNDQRVSNCVLASGDRIRVGGTTLVYEVERSTQ